jgi:hypothetical protein
LQDILLPSTHSPVTASPAFTFTSTPPLDIQESYEEQGISDMEFNSMDMNWSLSSEVTDQFLDLISSPLQSVSEMGEISLTAEPIVI